MSDPAVDVPSEIKRVTVHRRDALVRRVAEVGGRSLPLSIRVGPLPLAIHPGGVRAAVIAGAAGLPEAAATVHVAVEPVGERGHDRPELERAVDDAQRAVDATAAETERLRVELTDIRDRLVPVPRDRARTGDRELVSSDRQVVPAERRLALLRFADEQAVSLAAQLVDAEAAHRSATRSLVEATDRLHAVRRDAGRPHELAAVAIVTVQGAGRLPDDATLEVSYLVAGATWRPSHRLHLDGERSRLTLGGIVRQQTGEDWVGAQVELSTTEARSNWELPELKPVRIGRAAPPTIGWRAPEPLPAELFVDFDQAVAAAEHELEVAAPPASYTVEGEPITTSTPAVPPGVVPAMPVAASAATGGAAEMVGMVERAAGVPLPPGPPPPPVAAPAPMMAPQAMPTSAPRRGRMKANRVRSVSGAGAASDAYGRPGAEEWLGLDESATEPERPDQALADLDQLVLPAPAAAGRGRPRSATGRGPVEAMDRARHESVAALERGLAGHHVRLPTGVPACVYRTPGAVDIPSSRSASTVVVGEIGVEPVDEYVTVPYQVLDVFRTVVFTNPFEMPVVSGPIDVSSPTGYLGSATVDTLAPGAVARLGIGVEDGIGVKREVEHREDARGMRRNNRSLVHEVTVRVTNRLAHAVKVVVRERIPTTPKTEERVSVSELSVDPPWQVYIRPDAILEGGRQWSVDIEPAASVDVKAEWEIIIPAKHELEGGNRR